MAGSPMAGSLRAPAIAFGSLLLFVALAVPYAFPGISLGDLFGSDDAAPFASGTSPLQAFSQAHEDTLLWGTYRPGIYFGTKSRTFPEAVSTGLMWRAKSGALRHECSMGDGLARYGWRRHDGSTFGVQDIEDPAAGLHMETLYVRAPKTAGGGWAASVRGRPTETIDQGDNDEGVAEVFFYVAIDCEHDCPRASNLKIAARDGVGVTIAGELSNAGTSSGARGVENFSLALRVVRVGEAAEAPSLDEDALADRVRVSFWGTSRERPALKVHDTVKAQLKRDRTGGQLPNRVPKKKRARGTTLVVVQWTLPKDFEILALFEPQPSAHAAAAWDWRLWGAAQGGQSSSNGRELHPLNRIAERRAAAEANFVARFDSTFRLADHPLRQPASQGGAESPANEPELRRFAEAALSELLGGLGFYYGSSLIAPGRGAQRPGSGDATASTSVQARTPAGPLFTGSPSRPFFPRGFLWDEGFHQSVIVRWDPGIAQDVIAHWMSRVQPSGWLPREQILGSEARSRVPSEFVPQHPNHANPPTLLLALEALMDVMGAPVESGRLEEAHGKSPMTFATEAAPLVPFLRAIWPRLERWFVWLKESQASASAVGGHAWRAREELSEGKMFANTLSSGLDDYPRTSHPDPRERHVDLHCWLARSARLMSNVASRIGDTGAAARYGAAARSLADSLDALHWHEGDRSYADFGLHIPGKVRPFGHRVVLLALLLAMA
jgi:mannosyl-oligosaccharide glucosidase